MLQASTSDANEFIVNGDDRYYLFNAWQTSWSDRKLKKNIESITNGLDICNKLNPVTFNWKKEWAEGDAGLSNRKFYGIIAQELQEVLPELVYEGKDKLIEVLQQEHNLNVFLITYLLRLLRSGFAFWAPRSFKLCISGVEFRA